MGMESFYYEHDNRFRDLSSQFRLYMMRDYKDECDNHREKLMQDFYRYREFIDTDYCCDNIKVFCKSKIKSSLKKKGSYV
jgi:hypothetical protein